MVAAKRLHYLLSKFKRDENLFEMYKSNIQEYLEKGYARKMTTEEIQNKTSKTWYLPHHGVIHPNKPGKVRTVFDASSKHNGSNLNENLQTGPDLLNNLVGILLRFRMYRYAIMADIEAMFLQVRLKPPDREAVRFLWKENIHNDEEPSHYQLQVHMIGARDSPCCACFALRKTVVDNRDSFGEEVIESVMKNFYMDDFIKSVNSEEEGLKLSLDLIELMHKGGFRLTKFNSNSQMIVEGIPSSELAKSKLNLNFEENKNEVERTLGIKWILSEDQFIFTSTPKIQMFTKRELLRVTSSIFDPLGFLSPFILRAKLIIQDLWKSKIEWDEEINQSHQQLWRKWLMDLENLKFIRISRCLKIEENCRSIQLHIFCDASESAFAAVSYIRVKDQDGKIHCNLVTSKSRLAPLKSLTLPRLELQGAVLGVRMKNTIVKEIQVDFESITFWTDSMINIQYINNEERRFKVFVSNRVAEIRKYSKTTDWRHIDGKLNPADLATRGEDLLKLYHDSRWFKGPEFLYEDEEPWLHEKYSKFDKVNENDPEIRVNTNITCPEKNDFTMVNYSRFSNWIRLVSTIAWLYIFINNLKTKLKSTTTTITLRNLTDDEYNVGKSLLIKLIQRESFPDEVKALQSQKQLSKSSPLLRFDPFIDENGILRVGGRLKYAAIPYASKHQIILPSHHHAVKILIIHLHMKHHHCGQNHLLGVLRQEYWIIKGRSMVRNVVRNCMICKKSRPKLITPKMGNLPSPRVEMSSPPFFNCGIDYFGPITVKILRSKIKRWGCIFTCLSTRAIHLEVAESLDTDAFINTLERFVNRRGYPSLIMSDNGTNFKGGERELREAIKELDQQKICQFARRKGFKWQFNPPEAPPICGAWERLVKSVKIALKIIMKNTLVDDFKLMTFFTEVEALVNSRPLTPISDDIEDLDALTPNHFLLGRASLNLTPCIIYDLKVQPRKRWKHVQQLSNHFWKRWTNEYLPMLTTRQKWKTTDANNALKVGELVMVSDQNDLRGHWPLGRIIATFPGDDGVIRVVDVKTKNGDYVESP